MKRTNTESTLRHIIDAYVNDDGTDDMDEFIRTWAAVLEPDTAEVWSALEVLVSGDPFDGLVIEGPYPASILADCDIYREVSLVDRQPEQAHDRVVGGHVIFLNEWDIENLVLRFQRAETPNLLAGAEALSRLRDWTNANSDGWAYWSKPLNAAARLMTLLQSADRFDPVDCTDANLRKACTPIKQFLTKQNVEHSDIFPCAYPNCHEVGVRPALGRQMCVPHAKEARTLTPK